MARSVDDFKAPQATWGDHVRSYEQEKRHAVDSGLVSGQALRLKPGMFQAQERTFDPLLGRYRDNSMEAQQRHHEERERVAHLNRAKDIQILREQPFNIVSQESKLEKEDRRPHLKEKSPRVRKVPAFLCKDFDIVTNKYLDNHSEKLRQEKRVNLMEARPSQSSKACKDGASGGWTQARLASTLGVVGVRAANMASVAR
ncbi:unnamed protein product [Effrenium voratum]|nr:unnamed protein product [Effrenium voratum]